MHMAQERLIVTALTAVNAYSYFDHDHVDGYNAVADVTTGRVEAVLDLICVLCIRNCLLFYGMLHSMYNNSFSSGYSS